MSSPPKSPRKTMLPARSTSRSRSASPSPSRSRSLSASVVMSNPSDFGIFAPLASELEGKTLNKQVKTIALYLGEMIKAHRTLEKILKTSAKSSKNREVMIKVIERELGMTLPINEKTKQKEFPFSLTDLTQTRKVIESRLTIDLPEFVRVNSKRKRKGGAVDGGFNQVALFGQNVTDFFDKEELGLLVPTAAQSGPLQDGLTFFETGLATFQTVKDLFLNYFLVNGIKTKNGGWDVSKTNIPTVFADVIRSLRENDIQEAQEMGEMAAEGQPRTRKYDVKRGVVISYTPKPRKNKKGESGIHYKKPDLVRFFNPADMGMSDLTRLVYGLATAEPKDQKDARKLKNLVPDENIRNQYVIDRAAQSSAVKSNPEGFTPNLEVVVAKYPVNQIGDLNFRVPVDQDQLKVDRARLLNMSIKDSAKFNSKMKGRGETKSKSGHTRKTESSLQQLKEMGLKF